MVVGDLILCIGSGYSLSYCGLDIIDWRVATYGICFTHGLLGLINNFNKSVNVHKIYDFTLSVVTIVPLPFMTSDLYLANSMDRIISLIHAASGILPLVTDLLDSNSGNVRDLIIIGNAASLTFLGLQKDQQWYIALALLGTVNHFCTRKMGQDIGLPPHQAYSVGLAIFCLISILKT